MTVAGKDLTVLPVVFFALEGLTFLSIGKEKVTPSGKLDLLSTSNIC